MTKLYNTELHKIFSIFTINNRSKLLRDNDGSRFGWKYNKLVKSKKILSEIKKIDDRITLITNKKNLIFGPVSVFLSDFKCN